MLFFCDDSAFPYKSSTHNIFCRGGFFTNSKNIPLLYTELKKIKQKYGIDSDLPIKWNLRDSRLQKDYVSKLGKNKYLEVLRNSDKIRAEILSFLPKLEIKSVVSIRLRFGSASISEIVAWAFKDILQRYAYELKTIKNIESFNSIIIDWEHEHRRVLCEVYKEAFEEAKNYFAGRILDSAPFLSFSVSEYNSLLQIADLIVGCTAEFFKTILKNNGHGTPRTELSEQFSYVVETFRRGPHREIFRYGLIVSPKKLETNIKELLT